MGENEGMSRKVRILTTGCAYFTYFAFGLASSFIGPALQDLAERTSSHFAQVAYAFMLRNVLYCVSSLLCSFAFRRINRQLTLIIAILVSAVAILVTPFTHRLSLYFMAEGTFGLLSAIMDVVCNAIILEVWEFGPNPYMQGLHFAYSVGMTIAPLLVEPFLSYTPVQDLNKTMNALSESGEEITEARKSRIEVPYAIGASGLFLAAAALIVLQLKFPYRDPKRSVSQGAGDDDSNNNADSEVIANSSSPTPVSNEMSVSVSHLTSLVEEQSYKRYSYTVIMLGSLILVFYSGVEATMINFLPTFAVHLELGISKSKAAFMTSVFSAAYAVCRGLSILLAMKLRPRPMLYSCIGLLVFGNILLWIFANSSEPMLWFALLLLGIGHSSVIPAVYSLCEERINVTTAACSLFILSTTVAPAITPAVLAAFVDKTPLVLVYMNMAGLAVVILLFASLHVVDERRKRAKAIRMNGGFVKST